jgi:threonine-phosphate decarboxylase
MQRLNCEMYPCHFQEQDCSLCFCPFYPCGDERTGGTLTGGEWLCRGCLLVHRKEVSEAVLDALMRDDDLSVAWKEVERFLS